MGPSSSQGASIRSWRIVARKVRVFHLPRETLAISLWPLAFGRPSSRRRHIRSGPGLIDEDQTLRGDAAAVFLPLRPLTPASGTAEREAAPEMIDTHRPMDAKGGERRITLAGDKGFDVADFVEKLRARGVTPHIAVQDHLTKTGKH